MQIRLKKFRRGSAVVLKGHKWNEVGQVVEVPDEVGHALIGEFSDMLEIVADKPKPKAKPKKAAEDDADDDAEKMAADYANKML